MGGLPFSGFGMKTSIGQISTHLLHPLQMSGLKSTGLPGPGRFGTAYAFCSISLTAYLRRLVYLVCLVYLVYLVCPVSLLTADR